MTTQHYYNTRHLTSLAHEECHIDQKTGIKRNILITMFYLALSYLLPDQLEMRKVSGIFVSGGKRLAERFFVVHFLSAYREVIINF